MQHYRSLQTGRAFAAGIVVLGHSYNVTSHVQDGGLHAPAWLKFGYAGVDIFFVLSGFIISLVTDGSSASAAKFLRRRVLRIIPFYWIFTALWIALLWIGRHPIPHVPEILASLFLIPWYGLPVLQPGWTLHHEFVFYIIVSILIFLDKLEKLPLAIFALFLCGVVSSVIVPTLSGANFWDGGIFSLYHLEFLAGVLIYRHRERFAACNGIPLVTASMVMMLATSGVMAALYGDHVPTQPEGLAGLVRVCLYTCVGTLLIGGLIGLERNWARLFEAPGMRFFELVGDASYGLYLSHFLIFAVLGIVVAKVHLPPASASLVMMMSVVTAVAFAIGWYFVVEKPYLAHLQSARRRRAGLVMDGAA